MGGSLEARHGQLFGALDWRDDEYKRTDWWPLAVPKLSSICTRNVGDRSVQLGSAGTHIKYPENQCFLSEMQGHKGCVSGIWCFLAYSNNNDNVRNLPTTGSFCILNDKNSKSLVHLLMIFAPVAWILFLGCCVFHQCSSAPPSVRWPALSRVLWM